MPASGLEIQMAGRQDALEGPLPVSIQFLNSVGALVFQLC